ncbi:MAG: SWIM zinc finger family protein [Bacteroidota bacterium]
MKEQMTYAYANESQLKRAGSASEELFLAQYNELNRGNDQCYFWGRLTDPFITSKCLIALSNTVKSSFNLSPFQISLLKDPIVTAGNDKVRFEGFSHCASVYARVDVLPNGHDGEFLENGTTNVDFNQPMINSLSSIQRKEDVILSVGEKEVGIHRNTEKTVERKVPLPVKWIKGLTTVQIYLSDTDEHIRLNKLQTIQLFRSIPKGKVKNDYYLIKRGGQYSFTPLATKNSICVGGVHRLRLLEPLLPMIKEMRVFAHENMQSTTWQLYFGDVKFSFSLSRDPWRGFSGEGAALDMLIEDVPEDWIQRLDNYSYANQSFNPTLLAINNSIELDQIDNLTSRLAAMGLLGFDLDDNEYFYRRLPFKLERILGLNPRIEQAEKLVKERKVVIKERTATRVEARVEGSGVHHIVILENGKGKCTCTWFARHRGERGPCKHILATKKVIQTS